jgi:hypothetical protein
VPVAFATATPPMSSVPAPLLIVFEASPPLKAEADWLIA